MKTIPFKHAGKDFEIRIVSDGYAVHIRAFHDGKPANGYRYHIDLPMRYDAIEAQGIDPVSDFVELAKEDVIKEKWEKLETRMSKK